GIGSSGSGWRINCPSITQALVLAGITPARREEAAMPEKLIMVREGVYRELVEALRPFAEVDYEELIGAPDDMPIGEALRKAGQPTVGDLRRAMDAIAKAEGRS